MARVLPYRGLGSAALWGCSGQIHLFSVRKRIAGGVQFLFSKSFLLMFAGFYLGGWVSAGR